MRFTLLTHFLMLLLLRHREEKYQQMPRHSGSKWTLTQVSNSVGYTPPNKVQNKVRHLSFHVGLGEGKPLKPETLTFHV